MEGEPSLIKAVSSYRSRQKNSAIPKSAFLAKKSIQPAEMLRIRSSLPNKAHSGEVHLINTVSVYHALGGMAMIPESTRVSAWKRRCSTYNVGAYQHLILFALCVAIM